MIQTQPESFQLENSYYGDWQMEPERLTSTHLANRAHTHTKKEINHVDILLYQHVAHC